MAYRKLFFVFAGAVGLIAIVLVGAGISIIEAPATMQLKKADKRRVMDFRVIDQAVDQYFTVHDRMPLSLAELAASTSRRISWSDPETKEPYSYKILSGRTAEICANFNLSNAGGEDTIYFAGVGAWHHEAGENCFQIEVETEKD